MHPSLPPGGNYRPPQYSLPTSIPIRIHQPTPQIVTVNHFMQNLSPNQMLQMNMAAEQFNHAYDTNPEEATKTFTETLSSICHDLGKNVGVLSSKGGMVGVGAGSAALGVVSKGGEIGGAMAGGKAGAWAGATVGAALPIPGATAFCSVVGAGLGALYGAFEGDKLASVATDKMNDGFMEHVAFDYSTNPMERRTAERVADGSRFAAKTFMTGYAIYSVATSLHSVQADLSRKVATANAGIVKDACDFRGSVKDTYTQGQALYSSHYIAIHNTMRDTNLFHP